MKRQSTVAKLSKTILRQLIEFCKTWNCGVIVRFNGRDVGYTACELQAMLKDITSFETIKAGFKWTFGVIPTIRKGWNSLDGLTTTSLPQQTNKLSKGSEND